MALQWSSVLAVGVPEIDAQHEELFLRVDRLHDAMLARDRAGAVELIGYLGEYVRTHFGMEEGLMRAVGYPEREPHADEHARFAAAVVGLQRALAEEGATAALVLRLEREVSGWLRRHVYTADQALGAWIRDRRSAEAR